MKKILSCILILSALAVSAQSALAYDEYVYTANGIIESASVTPYDNRLTAMSCPGTCIRSDGSIFDYLITNQYESDGWYSCYGSSSCSDTLTVGTVRFYSDDDRKQVIQKTVQDQINYIERIGGIMTGYTLNSEPTRYETYYSLNISWDVDGMHHYAHFEQALTGDKLVGYYDLMYSDNSQSQNLIQYMNEHFGIAYEDQS